MKEKLTVIVHKFNNSILIVKRQSDLSTLLGVSLSTIRRKYNEIGYYDTDIYAVYVGPEIYNNDIETKYKHDVKPPIAKTYNNSERTNTIQDNVQKNVSNHNIIQSIPIKEDIIDDIDTRDWRVIEKELDSMSEWDQYYSTCTLEQLKLSGKYFEHHADRMRIINKYGLLRQND